MEIKKIRIDLLPHYFRKEDGTFNKTDAITLGGKIAGICYDKEGFSHLDKETPEKTARRVDMTLNNGHHSVYDHLVVTFNIQNIPKILAMVINNEHEYTTSEKSARYTPVVRESADSYITEQEETLYNKWLNIFKVKIKESYGYIYNDSKITKLAQENARYFVTVFMPTQMAYTTSLRQMNYIASWMMKYMDESIYGNDFQKRLATSMQEFIYELERIDFLEPGLLKNEKERKLSLFGEGLDKKEIYYGDIYSTLYEGSFAEYAQVHRHRTLNYQLEILDKKEYFIPPIIKDDPLLVSEWLEDMNKVRDITPQGEKVRIWENGTYNNFILKCKERLCSAAQLEIMLQTRETLLTYKKALEERNHPLSSDIQKYAKGARCTFPDYTCNSDCGFKEGKILTRKI